MYLLRADQELIKENRSMMCKIRIIFSLKILMSDFTTLDLYKINTLCNSAAINTHVFSNNIISISVCLTNSNYQTPCANIASIKTLLAGGHKDNIAPRVLVYLC